jgi:hypothetical protein
MCSAERGELLLVRVDELMSERHADVLTSWQLTVVDSEQPINAPPSP